jgi:hypothetical protein
MRIAEGGIDGWLRWEARKIDMMSSMLDVRGPFQSSHFFRDHRLEGCIGFRMIGDVAGVGGGI